MTFFKNEVNKNDLWDKNDLLASTYEPGMLFLILLSPLLTRNRHIFHQPFRCPLKKTNMYHIERLLRSSPVTAFAHEC